MSADHLSSGQFTTPVDSGDAREDFLSDFLQRHLPNWLILTSGELVDNDGLNSPQQDIVIYRPDIPHFKIADRKELLFIEGAISTIEVKSNLDTDNLKSALKNIANIKRMNRLSPIDLFMRPYDLEDSYLFSSSSSKMT